MKALSPITLIACLLLLFAACSEDSGSELEGEPLPADFEAMLQEVATIRGLPAPTNVRYATVPRAEVAGVVDALFTDAEREAMDDLTRLYRLLGHLGPTQDYRSSFLQLMTNAAIGFYAPETRTMWLVSESDGASLDQLNELERATLAHEFVHAVQDAAFDVERLEFEAPMLDDRALALSAVLEGDAVVHERLWQEAQLVQRGVRVFLNASLTQATVPPSLEREWRFPYSAGLDWAGAIRNESGQAGVDAVMRERRPISTAEIMHPAIRTTGWLPETVTLPDISGGLGDGWEQSGAATLGEFRLANYLQLWLPSLESLEAANGWSGDHFTTYANGEDTLAVFRVKFFDAKDAGEFAATHQRYFQAAGAAVEQEPGREVANLTDGRTVIQLTETAQDEVIFVIGSNAEVARAAANLLANL